MPVAAVITSAAEAEGITRWAVVFTLAEPAEKLVLLTSEEFRSEVQSAVEKRKAEGTPAPQIEIITPEGELDPERILKEVHRVAATLLIVGKNRRPGVSDESLRLSRILFDRAPCTTVMLRLGTRLAGECDSVLIPSAGGPNSREALRLGSRLTKQCKGCIAPLFVVPEIGAEDGLAVGGRILDRAIEDAGVDSLDRDHICKEIVVANNTDAGIARAAREKPYDLLLVGATHSGSVRRKLFGAIPDRLLEGENAMSIAVVRHPRSAADRIRERVESFFSLRIPQLEREDRIALFDNLQTNSRWSFDFMVLIILSTGIASLGLIQSSPAVVIGAMLVAPLMTPLIGSGLALVQGNLPMMRRCLQAIVLGFFAALCVGLLAGLVAPVTDLTLELRARGGPTLLDMGVAFLSGVAASYCIARPGLSSALAGVAIAAALVPPIATVGISIALLEFANARGAALLFGTNVVAIILGASLNFFAAGIRGRDSFPGKRRLLWARRTIVGLLIVSAILVIPLSTAVISRVAARFGLDQRDVIERHLDESLAAAGFDPDFTVSEIEGISRDRKGSGTLISGTVQANRPVPDFVAAELARFAKEKLKRTKVEVRLRTEIVARGLVEKSEPTENAETPE